MERSGFDFVISPLYLDISHDLPDTIVVDMRKHRDEVLAPVLVNELKEALAAGEAEQAEQDRGKLAAREAGQSVRPRHRRIGILRSVDLKLDLGWAGGIDRWRGVTKARGVIRQRW